MKIRAVLFGMLTLVLLALGGWLLWVRMNTPQLLGDDEGGSGGASPELAEATLDRVEALRAGPAGGHLALGEAELSSVMRYALPGLLPPGVADPAVGIREGTMTLGARVATAAFPDLPALGDVIGMLPDTVDVIVQGRIASFGKESLAYRVSSIEAAGIPLPDRLIPDVLAALGRQERKSLPETALHIPLPGGIDSVYVIRDSLMLVSDR